MEVFNLGVVVILNGVHYLLMYSILVDMAPDNRGLWDKLHVTYDHPFFDNPVDTKRRVYCLADCPHLGRDSMACKICGIISILIVSCIAK